MSNDRGDSLTPDQAKVAIYYRAAYLLHRKDVTWKIGLDRMAQSLAWINACTDEEIIAKVMELRMTGEA